MQLPGLKITIYHLSFSPTCAWWLWATVSSVIFGNVELHTLPRPRRLNDTLLPVSPLQPQGTTSHSGQNEGNDFDFLPLFTHQMVKGKRTVHWSWLSWINKLMPQCECVYAHVFLSHFKLWVCQTQYNVCVEEQVSSLLQTTALHQCWHYVKGKYSVIE